MVNNTDNIDTASSAQELQARIALHQEKLGTNNDNYVKLGMHKVGLLKKITFVALKVISCLTIVLAPFVFHFINKHLTKIANETISKDNFDIIKQHVPEFDEKNEETLKILFEKKLIEEGKYITGDELQSIVDVLNPKLNENEENENENEVGKKTTAVKKNNKKPALLDEIKAHETQLENERSNLEKKIIACQEKVNAAVSKRNSLVYDYNNKVRAFKPNEWDSARVSLEHDKIVKAAAAKDEAQQEVTSIANKLSSLEAKYAEVEAKINEQKKLANDLENPKKNQSLPKRINSEPVPVSSFVSEDALNKIETQKEQTINDLAATMRKTEGLNREAAEVATNAKRIADELKFSNQALTDTKKKVEKIEKQKQKTIQNDNDLKNLQNRINELDRILLEEKQQYDDLENQLNPLRKILLEAQDKTKVARENLAASLKAFNNKRNEKNRKVRTDEDNQAIRTLFNNYKNNETIYNELLQKELVPNENLQNCVNALTNLNNSIRKKLKEKEDLIAELEKRVPLFDEEESSSYFSSVLGGIKSGFNATKSVAGKFLGSLLPQRSPILPI